MKNARIHQRFVTSDYILDETATLLRAHSHPQLAGDFLLNIKASMSCRIVWMDVELFNNTTRFFIQHGDQDWSFTDCVSFVVMRQMKLHTALIKDHRFRAAGFDTPLLR